MSIINNSCVIIHSSLFEYQLLILNSESLIPIPKVNAGNEYLSGCSHWLMVVNMRVVSLRMLCPSDWRRHEGTIAGRTNHCGLLSPGVLPRLCYLKGDIIENRLPETCAPMGS